MRTLAAAPEPTAAELGVDLLGQLGSAEDLELLGRRLTDASPQVRSRACQAIARLGDPSVADPLVATLADPDPVVRREAATALATVGDRSAASELIRIAQTDEHETAVAAATAVAVVAPDLAVRVGSHAAASAPLRQAAALIQTAG